MAAVPKYATKPRKRARHIGQRVANVANKLGTPLMPWQQSFVDVATQLKYGKFERRTALATVPRQSGKTVLVQAIALDRMIHVDGSYSIYIAQTRSAASSRLRDMGKKLVRSGIDPLAKVTLGVGNERLVMSNGSVLEVQSPNADSTHGESVDLAIIDEAWAVDEIVLEGVLPAMSARPDSQLFMISTAGTMSDSHLLNRYCELARTDPQGSIAYVEYSMPDDAHPFDVDRWPEWMPALGHTVDSATIIDQMDKLDAGKFRRAYGNIPTATSGEAIPLDWWNATKADFAIPRGITIGVDATSRGASVAVAYQTEDGWHVDPYEYRGDEYDASWVVQTVRDLARYSPALIAFDPASSAAPALPELQDVADTFGVPLRKFTLRERCSADQWLYEALRDQSVTHSSLPALEAAVEGAVTRSVGDLWRFDRMRSLVDVSPLIACSMAVYAAHEHETLAPQAAIF